MLQSLPLELTAAPIEPVGDMNKNALKKAAEEAFLEAQQQHSAVLQLQQRQQQQQQQQQQQLQQQRNSAAQQPQNSGMARKTSLSTSSAGDINSEASSAGHRQNARMSKKDDSHFASSSYTTDAVPAGSMNKNALKRAAGEAFQAALQEHNALTSGKISFSQVLLTREKFKPRARDFSPS
jgi:transcription initiation factor TFIID subunit TAF12